MGYDPSLIVRVPDGSKACSFIIFILLDLEAVRPGQPGHQLRLCLVCGPLELKGCI